MVLSSSTALPGSLPQLTPDDVLLDLYCGAGTIGLSLAHQVKEVIGVEIVREAVENATQNARKNGIENARVPLRRRRLRRPRPWQRRASGPMWSSSTRPGRAGSPDLLHTIAEMNP